MYVITIVGVIIFATCIGLLIIPFLGWRHTYIADESPATINIPKAGKYAFFVICHRSLNSYGNKRRIHFSVAIFDAQRKEEFVSAHSMTTTRGTGIGIDILRVGLFNAPHSGKFLIKNLPDSHYAEKDKILMRRYVSKLRQIILILGITISPHMITSGLIGGLVSLGGLVLGIILLAINW